MWRFDGHVHSHHSRDAKGAVLELAQCAQERGLHGFALTDHDTVAGHAEIEEAMQATGLLIVPGIEVTSAEGHILAWNVHDDIAKGRSLPRTVAAIRDQGGVAVAAHPLRMFSGLGPEGLRTHSATGALRAAEGLNARERRLVQQNTQRVVAGLGIAAVGGSDAHWVEDIGTAYTVFDHAPADAAALVAMVRDGLCRPAGGNTARHQVWKHSLSLAVPAKWRKRAIEQE